MLDDAKTIEAKQDIITELLKELPTDTAVVVDLPSENRLYTLEEPGAPITIRPMTFQDEKHIISAHKNQDPVNLILQRCVSNLNIGEILSLDKLYLIMKLREVSYGDDYHTLLICSHCKEENKTVVRLSELNINPVPDDFADPVEITLPSLNKLAKVRIPRVKDEVFLTEDIHANLWRFVVDIDGHSDKMIINGVLEKLPIKDTRCILNAMKTNFGVETKVKFECKKCQEVNVVDLPIDANFFDVN